VHAPRRAPSPLDAATFLAALLLLQQSCPVALALEGGDDVDNYFGVHDAGGGATGGFTTNELNITEEPDRGSGACALTVPPP